MTGGTLELGEDPEFDETHQVLRDVRFLSRQEIRALDHVYPEYLRDEVWHVLSGEDLGYDVFKERENVRNK